MMPVSWPLSQWSHQRVSSVSQSMAGPGLAQMRVPVRPGTDDALRGAAQVLDEAEHRRGNSRRPSR